MSSNTNLDQVQQTLANAMENLANLRRQSAQASAQEAIYSGTAGSPITHPTPAGNSTVTIKSPGKAGSVTVVVPAGTTLEQAMQRASWEGYQNHNYEVSSGGAFGSADLSMTLSEGDYSVLATPKIEGGWS